MVIKTLSVGPGVGTLSMHTPGITIAVTPTPGAPGRMIVAGCSRMPADEVQSSRLEALHSIFITAIGAATQASMTQNLVGPRVVFEEDVDGVGDDYMVHFRAEVVLGTSIPLSFLLHASSHHRVSNVVWVVG